MVSSVLASSPIFPPLPLEVLKFLLEARLQQLRAGVHASGLFGQRRHPITHEIQMHNGLDLAAPLGTPIYAVADGAIERRWNDRTCGGLQLRQTCTSGPVDGAGFAHLSSACVREGDAVKAGQKIGQVGSTGRSTGPHLHLVLRIAGRPIDPLPLLLWCAGIAELPWHNAG